MARDNDIAVLSARAAAAAAGTVNVFIPVGSRPLLFNGFNWMYETAEANTDNTLNFKIEFTTDGTAFTTMQAVGANAMGLLDTGAPDVEFVNRISAAAGGNAAAAAAAPAQVRVPANAVIRTQIVTAGTGTIPAIQVSADCVYV